MLNIYIYINVYIYVLHIHIYIYIYAYTYTCVFTYMCVYMYTYRATTKVFFKKSLYLVVALLLKMLDAIGSVLIFVTLCGGRCVHECVYAGVYVYMCTLIFHNLSQAS